MLHVEAEKETLYTSPSPHANSFVIGTAVINTHYTTP
jgi:hypothetical protein